MADTFLPSELGRIRQAFLLGLARQPIAVPPSFAGMLPIGQDPALALLALAGQHQRFSSPPAVTLEALSEAARHLHADPRPILPAAARTALQRLSLSVEKGLATTALTIAAQRVTEAGFRLHPFDLPDLAKHLAGHTEKLGLSERAYLALVASDPDDDSMKGVFFECITIDNWTTFPRAQRRSFLVDQRRADATAARGLLENVWKNEPAPMRLALLDALAVNLGPADAPFLENLATDRAETVKQAAVRLLARMPSSAAYETRLAAAAQCFTRPSKSGLSGFMRGLALGRDTATLTFALPVQQTAANWTELQALRERMFLGLPLTEIAAAVAVTPEEIITALPPDEHGIFMLFVETAKVSDDKTLLARIVGARLLMAKSVSGYMLVQLVQTTQSVLPVDIARRVLAAPQLAAAITDYVQATTPSQVKDDGRLLFTAALMPRAAMPEFVAMLEPLSAATTRAARDFADLIKALPDPGVLS